MIIYLIKFKKIFFEFLFIFIFLFICFYIFYIDILKDFNNDGVGILFLISPVLCLYFLFKIFFPIVTSFFITTSIVLLIEFINREKISKTGDVLYFNDIFSVNNFLVAKQYIGLSSIFFIATVIIVIILLLFIEKRNRRGALILNFLAFSFFFVFSVFNVSVVVNFFPVKLIDWINLNKRNYISWNIHENLNKNGLPLHLVQTSAAVIPKSTKKEKIFFDEIVSKKIKRKNLMTGSVFVLLCESCWFDKNNFEDLFNPLLDLGFKELRAISPVYGGGTVNSALEILTGIPSKSNLSGVVYQEYKDALSESIYSIPNELNKFKIKSYAFHNFHDDFWNRKAIMRKMGFYEYFGLSSMKNISDDYFPRDKVMYDFILDRFNSQGFYYMEGVHGHGPYESVDDYENKMKNVVSDFKEFFISIRKIDPQAKFLIYSDHKPALSNFFKNKNIISENSFIEDGGKIKGFKSEIFKDEKLSAEIYDVPVLFFNQVDDEYGEFFESANGKPLFCLSGAFSEYYLSLSLPSHIFNKDLCQSGDWFSASRGGYPEWITANSLFD